MSLVQALLSIGAAQVLMMLVALGRAKILSVLLGPAGYGIVATVDQTVISVVQLGGLSLPLAAMKFLSRDHSESHEAFRQAFSTFFRSITALSLAAVATAVALFLLVPTVFGEDVAAIREYLLLALLGVPAAMLNILFIHTLAAAQLNAAGAWVNMLVLFALTIAAATGVLFGGIGGLYVASVCMGLFTTLVTLWYLRARLGVRPALHGGSLLGELRRQPEVVRYSLLLYSALATYSVVMLVTRYYVFERLGAAGAGLLQALIGVALTLAAVPNAVATLYLAPTVNRVAPGSVKVESANEFARKVLLFITAGGVAVALFPRLVLTILFSPEFAPAAPALVAFVLWQCLHQVMNVYAQVLIGIDDVTSYAVITCAGYVAAALLLPPLIARFELAGAGLAFSTAAFAMLVVTVARLAALTRATMSADIALRTLVCVGSIAAGFLLFDVQTELQPRGIAARGGYVLVATILVIAVLTPPERAYVRGLLRGHRAPQPR